MKNQHISECECVCHWRVDVNKSYGKGLYCIHCRDLHTKVQYKWAVRFLRLAREVSTWSKDPSTQAGAVIVRPDRTVASVGYNGFPRGMNDDPSRYMNREEKYSRIVHAEMNALVHSGSSVRGNTVYIWPFSPCDRCAVQLIQAGITHFVFPTLQEEHKERWKDILDKTLGYITECGLTYAEIPRQIVEG